MLLAKYATTADPTPRVGVVRGEGLRPLAGVGRLCDVLHAPDPGRLIAEQADAAAPALALDTVRLLAPIDAQEVWAAGVTYQRSKEARQHESEAGGSFYDQVYRADRPELFFKATPGRVVGPGDAVRVRRDSAWSVPEPELALVLAPDLRPVGLTIGNDMSARDIEGRNPLYLPQAKVYAACCALGPVVALPQAMPPLDALGIRMTIERAGATAFEGSTSTARMARRFEELIAWLGRDNAFPDGAILLTGTGLVPPDDFSLRPGDVVHIAIDGIGTLTNPVVQGPASG
ncbi:MAG TPA: fumarylacetoacetate hydrolase family protein [Isosphaeraceae bacterium]